MGEGEREEQVARRRKHAPDIAQRREPVLSMQQEFFENTGLSTAC